MQGRWCDVVPLESAIHGPGLFRANTSPSQWTYLAYGPFSSESEYRKWLDWAQQSDDPLFFAVIDRSTGAATGVASYLRIDTANGVIEVGHINFAPIMQRTLQGSEAMYLMMRNVFEQGYRRYEWKCDALNEKSRTAACRLGFQYEGTFRQASIYKGRNRDTAWYAIIDRDWPALRQAFEKWLDDGNFDPQGRQRHRLSDLTRAALNNPLSLGS